MTNLRPLGRNTSCYEVECSISSSEIPMGSKMPEMLLNVDLMLCRLPKNFALEDYAVNNESAWDACCECSLGFHMVAGVF